MKKAQIILWIVKAVMVLIALGVGIWYMSNSINGDSISYTSMTGFLSSIGVENGDIASANGCFMCGYIEKLFASIGTAAEMFWAAMLPNVLILIAIGFGIFLILTTGKHLLDSAKKTAKLDDSEKDIELKPWFDKIWKQFARVLFVAAILGGIGLGGTYALRGVANITIGPVMYVGSGLSMAATGVASSAQCGTGIAETDDILNPILKPFMCVIGNINAVMLAGAAGGFSLMNYSWMGMGGGAFTWLAGLALIIMFLIIGFDLFFQILSVIFKLVFLIIFLPLILAAAAFEGTWKIATGVLNNSINMLVKSAIRIVAITLKVIIIYAIVSFAADESFPGPLDGYNAILPPILQQANISTDAKTLSVMNVFSKCELVGLQSGQMDKVAFTNCFTASRAEVERKHPGAFDFMKNGFEFMFLMIGIFLLYYYAVSPKIDKLLGSDEKETFDFGGAAKEMGKTIWGAPNKIANLIAGAAKPKA